MRIITRTVLLLSVVSLFADIASEMLYPVIPVYLREIGFSVFLIGVLEGIVQFLAGISKGYFGQWSDAKGQRLPFVKWGYMLSAIAKPLLAVFVLPVWIFFVRSIDRLGKGVRTAARDALLSQEATPATKGRVFGFHRGMDTAGAAIGPILALLFLFFYPGQYTTLFYLAFIPGLLSVAAIFFIKEKKQPVAVIKKRHFFSFFSYWKIASPEFKKVAIGFLLFALFNSSDIFLLLITKETIGSDVIHIGNITFNSDELTIAAYIFYNLVYAIAAYPLGMIADRIGFRKTVLIGFFLFAVVYCGFAFQPSLPEIFLLFTIYGLYAAATEGVMKAWITNLSHNENTATAVGFYTSCESVAVLFASIFAGALWTNFGSQVTFLSTAIITSIVFFYFIFYLRRS
ncbi:MAG: MFS transporter [Chitinophagaceae bacterium]